MANVRPTCGVCRRRPVAPDLTACQECLDAYRDRCPGCRHERHEGICPYRRRDVRNGGEFRCTCTCTDRADQGRGEYDGVA